MSVPGRLLVAARPAVLAAEALRVEHPAALRFASVPVRTPTTDLAKVKRQMDALEQRAVGELSHALAAAVWEQLRGTNRRVPTGDMASFGFARADLATLQDIVRRTLQRAWRTGQQQIREEVAADKQKFVWDESQHPRAQNGEWTSTGGPVDLTGGAEGPVLLQDDLTTSGTPLYITGWSSWGQSFKTADPTRAKRFPSKDAAIAWLRKQHAVQAGDADNMALHLAEQDAAGITKNAYEALRKAKTTRQTFAWDESKHPRHPRGDSKGGEFANADAEAIAAALAQDPKRQFHYDTGEVAFLVTADGAVIPWKKIDWADKALLERATLWHSHINVGADGTRVSEPFSAADLHSMLGAWRAKGLRRFGLLVSAKEYDVLEVPAGATVANLRKVVTAALSPDYDTRAGWLAANKHRADLVEYTNSAAARNREALRLLASGMGWKFEERRPYSTRASFARKPKVTDLRDTAVDWFDANASRIVSAMEGTAAGIATQELARAVKTGETSRSVAQRIFERLLERGLTDLPAIEREVDDEALVADLLGYDTPEQALNYLRTTVRTTVAEAMNEARFAEATDPELEGYVVAFEYSAILDENTTEFCRYMDGRIYKADNPVWNTHRPPNHFNCRSVLIPLTKLSQWDGKESDPPELQPADGFTACGCGAEHYAWDESKHPRHPSGADANADGKGDGGKFAPADGAPGEALQDAINNYVADPSLLSPPVLDYLNSAPPLAVDKVVYRAWTKENAEWLATAKVGERRTFAHPLSTSQSLGGHEWVLGDLEDAGFDDPVRTKIQLLAGQSVGRAIRTTVKEARTFNKQDEFLLRPGLTLEVTGRTSTYVTLRQVAKESMAWDESKHPRNPVGADVNADGKGDGGKFAPTEVREVYHGTSSAYLVSIRKEGLRVKRGKRNYGTNAYDAKRGYAVFVVDSLPMAQFWADMAKDAVAARTGQHSESVVLHIRMPKRAWESRAVKDALADSEMRDILGAEADDARHYMVDGSINPDWIVGYYDGKGTKHTFAEGEDMADVYLALLVSGKERMTRAATARPLYVRRDVLNGEALLAWAKSQGFGSTLSMEDLHVTLAYSRAPVDWAVVPPEHEPLAVPAAANRMVVPLGDKGAVVLKFLSPTLSARWQALCDAGCSWDYDGFQPHVTITYDGAGVDLDRVVPYAGPLELGPEVQEALDEEWDQKIQETKA